MLFSVSTYLLMQSTITLKNKSLARGNGSSIFNINVDLQIEIGKAVNHIIVLCKGLWITEISLYVIQMSKFRTKNFSFECNPH